jgi:hypothetical protein
LWIWRGKKWRGSRYEQKVMIRMVSEGQHYHPHELNDADIHGSIEICGNEQFTLGRDPDMW